MKFLCGSCRTKYQISDTKVRGKVLTIRSNDLRTLALLLDQSEAVFAERLTDLGVAADGT